MRSPLDSPQAINETAIIQPEGSLNANTVMPFYHNLHAVVSSAQFSTLLLDLNQVDQIDRAGLMALVCAYKLAKKFNQQFFLCSVSRSVRIVLELTQLDRVFKIIEASPPGVGESSVMKYSGSPKRELVIL